MDEQTQLKFEQTAMVIEILQKQINRIDKNVKQACKFLENLNKRQTQLLGILSGRK